jgi:DNA-binding helix-hairpin-helix protein with protein kinase domain
LEVEVSSQIADAALSALRSVHASGFVHGDVRLEKFMAMNGNGPLKK